ncbi:MAG: hypothetical protein NVS9B4_24720 [Candidatus Acidiferrum sp.]
MKSSQSMKWILYGITLCCLIAPAAAFASEREGDDSDKSDSWDKKDTGDSDDKDDRPVGRVPEPGTLALLGTGSAGLLALYRRNKR